MKERVLGVFGYNCLSLSEQSTARAMFLDALNQMECEQALDAGKQPKPYTAESEYFKEEIQFTFWERYIDMDGSLRIRFKCY